MWNRYLALLMMATLLRLDYELNQPQEIYTDRFALPQPGNQSLASRQKEWSEKAVRKYTEAQEKKWQRWHEAMFERES